MKLRSKLILFFVIFTSLIIGVAFYYLNGYLKDYLKKQTVDNFKILAEISEGSYFTFIESMKIRIIDWSSDGYIRNTVEKILNITSTTSAVSKIERDNAVKELNIYLKEKKIIFDPSVIIIDILDKNGIVISSSRDDRLGIDEKAEEETFNAHRFSDAINAKFGEAFVSNVIFEKDEYDKPMIHMVARIFSAKNTSVPLNAVMLLHFANTDKLRDVIVGNYQKEAGVLTGNALLDYYKTADIYLVNQDKLMITATRFDKNTVLKQKVDTMPVKACFEENKEISEEYVNYSGKLVFGASMCLKRDNLVLAVEVQKDEIFISLKDLNQKLFLAIVLFLIINILGITFGSHWTLKNLKIVIAAAEEVSKNNFNARANVKSKDEIGYLANVFNRMIINVEKSQEDLKQAEVLIRDANLDLEKKVWERTQELENLKVGLEKNIAERTKELQEKLAELEKFKELTVGRELKMIELKKEIEQLKKT